VLSLCACALVGCGASSDLATSGPDSGETASDAAPAGPLTGSVDGVPFTALDLGASNSGPTAVGTYPAVEVSILDVPGACLDSIAARDPPGSRALHVWVINEVDQKPIAPGTYEVGALSDGGPRISAAVFLHELDASCVDQISTGTGTLILTEVSATTVRGSVDVSITGVDAGTTGRISGGFTAPICGPLDDGGASVCME
jgi:hypothetical protein